MALSSTPARYRTASNLLAVHREHEALLSAARLAVLAADSNGAGLMLERLHRRITEHIAHEEQWLIPAYERWVADPPRQGTAELIRRDHRLIEQALVALPPLFARWQLASALTQEQAHAAWIVLSEALADLAELHAHHDQREAESLFPLLDERMPKALLSELLSCVEATDSPVVPEEEPAQPGPPSLAPPPPPPLGQVVESMWSARFCIATGHLDGFEQALAAAAQQVDSWASSDSGLAPAPEIARLHSLMAALRRAAQNARSHSEPRALRLALLAAQRTSVSAFRAAERIESRFE